LEKKEAYNDWLNRLIFWVKYPFKLWIFELIDQWLLWRYVPQKGTKILFTRLDLIGDYLMVRPFFEKLKSSGYLKERPWVFAGNQICKDLAETFDSHVFEEWIWIDKARFLNDIPYRFKILKRIRKSGFDMAINLSHTRQFFLESVVRLSGAEIRIASYGTGNYRNEFESLLSDTWYSKLIQGPGNGVFEFERNRLFFSALVDEVALPTQLNQESWPDVLVPELPDRFFVLAPGASSAHRKWPIENFKTLGKWLQDKTGATLIIIGGKTESDEGEYLIKEFGAGLNLAGKLSLPQSMVVLRKSLFLISNESAPVHMAATTKTPAICLSQGNHFGRWNPYPATVAPWIKTIYPDEFYPLEQHWDQLVNAYHDFSNLPIQKVQVERVIKNLETWLEIKSW
jgi:ADP-heptose:LPS heptosyltransferase